MKTAVTSYVGVILRVFDKWLGGFQLLAEAASHLPFVGDKFRGVADAIGAALLRQRGERLDRRHVDDDGAGGENEESSMPSSATTPRRTECSSADW